MAPEREKLEFKIENGYIKIEVPSIKGYGMIVFE